MYWPVRDADENISQREARSVRAMNDGANKSLDRAGEYEALQQSIQELEHGLKRDTRYAALEIVALVAAISLLFALQGGFGEQPAATITVSLILLLVLGSRGHEVLRHSQTKVLLKNQLHIAAKHRVKADKLYDLSILDPLTGLHNRRLGERRLKEEIARAEKTGEPLAVVLFDLDYFKEINDKYGHAAGDAALKEFSRRLKRAVRACDIPVRLGGDEFLVILPECPRDKVDIILERTGAPKIECNGEKIEIRYSTGSAQYQYSDTAEAMLARADQVLYAKKQARPDVRTISSGQTPVPTEDARLKPNYSYEQRLAEID
ncbi:MAG: GGDEF domain-containing protein [Candidatus Acidiferrum sp.]